jgi:hypothetical protein
MSFFRKLFNRQKANIAEDNSSDEARRLQSFECCRDKLLSADKYLARSDYRQIVADFADFYRQMKALQDSDVLTES